MPKTEKPQSPAVAKAKQAANTPQPPQSPVLHGLKLGCKRRLEDCTPLSGGKVGGKPGMMRGAIKTEKGGIHEHLARTKAVLVLSDGTRLEGFSFGAECSVSGEVVFNTAMVGYPEALTDPSYRGQLLTLTFPMVGNYGVPSDVKDDLGLSVYFESEQVHITALIVSEYSAESCHWNLKQSLSDWLTANKIPALYGIDTRALTQRIRDHGAMLGKIIFPGDDEKKIVQVDPNKINLVAQVSCKEPKLFVSHAEPRLNMAGKRMRIVAIDCGIKANIIRYFMTKGVELLLVPWDHDISKEQYDGLFVSNGPGDPTKCKETIKQLKAILDTPDCGETGKPVFGICLGNQLLALAAGCKTYKMKYGNRGANQPCIDTRTNRCYITAQNHGFAVDATSLPEGWSQFFVNANDGTNEGIIHQTHPDRKSVV